MSCKIEKNDHAWVCNDVLCRTVNESSNKPKKCNTPFSSFLHSFLIYAHDMKVKNQVNLLKEIEAPFY